MEKIPVLRVRPFFTEEKEEGLRFGRIHVSEDFPDAAGDHSSAAHYFHCPGESFIRAKTS
jgi:hypothetical protein